MVLTTVFATFVPAATPSSATTTSVPFHRPSDSVTMLLVGDSMAEILGADWQHLAPHYGLRLYNYGIIGCGLTTTGEVKIKDQVFSDQRVAEFPNVKCGNWPKYWADEISTLHPQVAAMLFGPFEIRDHLVNGQWIHIGTPAFDKLERAHLQQAVSVLSKGGAKDVFFTSPYYDEGEQLDGSPWPEDDPARVNRLNKLLREVAATHPGTVRVIDLGGYLSPGGHYASVIRGVTVRTSSDIHVTPAGAAMLASLVFPQIIRLAQP
jgi:hypothetical protein